MTDPNESLTPQQLEFVALYASGHDIRAIAEMKFYSAKGVQKSLAAARERAGANSLAQLCVMAVDSGVIRKNGVGWKPVQEEGVVGE